MNTARTTALVLAAVGLASPAAADFRAWADFGEEIPGGSTDPGHERWVDIESFSAGHAPGSMSLTCHRIVDRASPLLLKVCADQKELPRVRIDLARVGKEAIEEFWELELQGVRVTACEYRSREGATESPEPLEHLRLEWTSLLSRYRVFPEGGEPYVISDLISPDGDGDMLPDAYEVEVGLDPEKSNKGLDCDGDGILDTDEYRIGTHPKDRNSSFVATSRLAEPGVEELVLEFPSRAGEAYGIAHSAGLRDGFATLMRVTATGPTTTVRVPRTLEAGFFRIEYPAP